MSLLEKIGGPTDIKPLDLEDLDKLAGELRQQIIHCVSANGGHLASNLGTVELTLALHKVFDSPVDSIVWDVGHQAYAHKLITGRRESFHTLRTGEGISGFPKRCESIHDPFGTGHSSTSISAALGMLEGKKRTGHPGSVVAVIGDGSMTAGLAFEGLNHAGHMQKKLTVILNDNDMSISPNVGALSEYLSRIMTGEWYNRVRKETRHLIESIPGIGESMVRLALRAEDTVKGFFAPGMLFEELGFEYVGPVDGHRIGTLIETLEAARKSDRPTLVHVITKKGKGYEPAEKKPTLFHGVGKFDIDTGEPVSRPGLASYSRVFGDTLIRLASENDRIVAITAAMTEGTGLDGFRKAHPDRFYDVGIAEPHAVTFAAGLAAGGIRPVVAIYSTFLQRGYDEIIHDVCLQNLPVVFALDRGGLVGEDGATHHGVFDLSYLRHIPNLMVMAPRNGTELSAMLKTALEAKGPSAIRFPRGNTENIDPGQEIRSLPHGQSELLKDGSDVLLLAVGSRVDGAREAAKRLHEEGISAAVIDARFVKPLDEERIVSLAKKTGRVITVEENALQGGFGAAVLECFNEHQVEDLRVRRLGIPDRFIQHGSQAALANQLALDTEGIVQAVRDLLAEPTPA